MPISDHEIEHVYAMGFQSGAATMYATLRPACVGEEAMTAGLNMVQVILSELEDDRFRSRFMEAARRTLAGEPPANELRHVQQKD